MNQSTTDDVDRPDASEPRAAPDSAPAPAAAAAGRSRRVTIAVIVATIALAGAVLATIVAVNQSNRADDLAQERADRRAVATVAAAFGQAYLSYDFRDVAGSGDRVIALVTDDFAADFEQTRVPGIEAVFAEIETTTVATTREVFVSDVGRDSARALVVVDVDAAGTTVGIQSLRNLSFVVVLVREGGEWKVDAVEPPPAPDVSGATTSTSVPPTSG